MAGLAGREAWSLLPNREMWKQAGVLNLMNIPIVAIGKTFKSILLDNFVKKYKERIKSLSQIQV